MASILNNNSFLSNNRQLANSQNKLKQTLARLSSGSRINRAFEDAAGLQISNNLRADIRINNQARINANNGLGITNIADGALTEATDLLTRAAEITMQAASGTTSSAGRDALDQEYQEILGQLDSLGVNTKFDGQALFGEQVDVRTGETTDESVSIDPGSLSTTDLGLNGSSINSLADADAAIGSITSAIEQLSAQRGRLGATQSRLQSTIDAIDTRNEATVAAESQIRDADIADEVVNLTKFQILGRAGVAAQSQSRLQQESVLRLLQG